MAVSVPGIISGINTTKLITELSQVYQAPITQLQSQVAQENSDLTAWGNFKSALSQLQSGLSGLSNINSLSQRSVTSSDTAVATATAGNSAVPGSYAVSVSGLAQAQSLYSTDFASPQQTQIGTGTLDIQTGSGSPVAVSITSSNDTLNGIAAAINNSAAGVKASVIYDGSGYRLSITGDKTGSASAFTVTASGATGSLSQLNYNSTTKNMTESTSARNAVATINGIAISSSTNTLSNAIPGLTVTLSQTGTSTLSVNQDVSGVTKAVSKFVTSFNSAMKTINQLTSYNSSTNTAGPLLGNAEVQSIRTQLLNAISGFGIGLPLNSQYNGLGSVGISINNDGTLSLNSSKLTSALQSNFSTVAGLLGRVGTSSSSDIAYVSAGAQTRPGSYAVNVSSPATQASVTASAAVPSGGITNSETLTISSGSTSVSVALAAGSTINTIVKAINQTLTQKGETGISAINQSGTLKLYSNAYGSAQKFTVVSNQPASGQTGIGTSALTGQGSDVVASVNGEATQGSGQQATVTGSGPAYGLVIKLPSSSTGNLGTINLSSGLYQSLNPVLTDALNPTNGSIAAATKSINSTITSLNKRISTLQSNLQAQKQLLQTQFNQMEQTLAQLQQTGNYLSSYFGTGSASGGSSTGTSSTGSSSQAG